MHDFSISPVKKTCRVVNWFLHLRGATDVEGPDMKRLSTKRSRTAVEKQRELKNGNEGAKNEQPQRDISAVPPTLKDLT